jgi:hypothetical protein
VHGDDDGGIGWHVVRDVEVHAQIAGVGAEVRDLDQLGRPRLGRRTHQPGDHEQRGPQPSKNLPHEISSSRERDLTIVFRNISETQEAVFSKLSKWVGTDISGAFASERGQRNWRC